MTSKRYARQIAFTAFGAEGQKRLAESSVLVVGAGGLGSWAAELLVRAGVGHLRLCDDDSVELSNLHRQSLYTEQDAAACPLKAEAAATRLRAINSECRIEPFAERIDHLTIHRAAKGVHMIVDGTDNFPTRFLLNDYAVKYGIPWVSAGVMEGQGQVLTLIPGTTPCLRCIIPSVPPCCGEDDQQGNACCQFGVLGPAVAAISAMQAAEAIKLLSGHIAQANPMMVKFDFWDNTIQRIALSKLRPSTPCPCCDQNEYEYLEP
ncbi:MAG TPA: HesA/MoeB/ThiF family protein [Phycisphaerales bacterium]|nr:HesA/MoeB/ThiF family protein [Phycisphaerales bacterium]